MAIICFNVCTNSNGNFVNGNGFSVRCLSLSRLKICVSSSPLYSNTKNELKKSGQRSIFFLFQPYNMNSLNQIDFCV